MTLAETARWVITIVILGAASSLTTALLVEDDVPFGDIRDRIVDRFPPRKPVRVPGAPGQPPIHAHDDTGQLMYVGSRLGTLVSCPRCMGVWVTACWALLYALTGRVGILIAVPFAIAAVQRWWNGV